MPIKDWRFAALDVETTGLEVSEGHQIVEVAVVRFSPQGLEERWSTLVKPSRPIPPDAARVHGIREADVAGAPPIEQVLPLVDEKTRGRVVVVHNAPFDLEFLTAACARLGREPIDRPLVDTLIVSRRSFPEAQTHSLTELAARLGVVPEGAHRALPDAVTTANVMLALLRRAEAGSGAGLLDPEAEARVERHLSAMAAAPATG
ncbi:MAG TPA: 3'-5' exonuclease [Candidatus Saccharimonadales bacterium]|nr:3'-5' exonuclease [Candidatus Saccharimonadales bacterium]